MDAIILDSANDGRACLEHVTALFPDICPDYLALTAEQEDHDPQRTITHILDMQESGAPYPKRPRPVLKRKRRDSNEEEDGGFSEATRRFDSPSRREQPADVEYCKVTAALLSATFPRITIKDLTHIMKANSNRLFPSLLAADRMVDECDDNNPPLKLMKNERKTGTLLTPEHIEQEIARASADKREIFEEFRAATVVRKARRDEREARKRREIEEAQNVNRAQADGTLQDCECCYAEYPLNRMVHCDGDTCHVWAPRLCMSHYVGNTANVVN